MENKIEVFKISGYDDFKCIANKCRFTCCEGMDVSVDNETFNMWNSEKDKFKDVLNNVRVNKLESTEKYIIDKRTEDRCPMLDEYGLCNIVKNHGDKYISLTCKSYPRFKNEFENKVELSLSCSCPEVVEVISKLDTYISIDCNKESSLENNIRNSLIGIIKEEDMSLQYKLIIGFRMLMSILESENMNEVELIEEVKSYSNKKYIKEFLEIYKQIDLNIEEGIEEITNLFIDITENYREVSGLEESLNEILDYCEEIEIEELCTKWNSYKVEFEKYSKIFENCIISKIISQCSNKGIEDIIISFELVIIEYLLARYAVFLKYCINGEFSIKDIKDYIVVFSRIIENNSDTVIEFLNEGFGDSILEEGYICFISLY